MAGKKRETLDVERVPLQFALSKNSDFEAGKFSGVASVFGSIVDTYPDRTRMRPGAFLKTINDRASRIKILAAHDQHAIWIGLPTVLKETAEGLYVEGSLNQTTLGKDVAEAMRHAVALGKTDSVEFSIGFDALDFSMVEEEDGELIREVTELRLWEISVVNFGADRKTRMMEAAARLDLERGLLPKMDLDAIYSWSIRHFKACREGTAPFSEHALLSEEQRTRLIEELALHAPAEPPEKALTEYEEKRKLAEIEIAEAEAAFALMNI